MVNVAKKIFKYDGLNVSYVEGGSGYPVILMHGWGCSAETMMPVFNHLASDFKVYNFDLPGFGESDEPKVAWSTVEYADMIKAFIDANCDVPPVLIGHSFGGRVSLRLGAAGVPKKMILTGCAGRKPKRGMDYYAKVYSYKAAKKVGKLFGGSMVENARKKAGSEDYQNASEAMKGVFIKAVNEDQRENLAKITAPTILYWGELDTATPLSDGEIMAAEMKDAALIKQVGATHYAFLERLPNFLAVTDSFLTPEKK